MTGSEFWIAYHFTSRHHLPPTTQLIELEFQNTKLVDLEDVLDHGYVEARYRPVTWWKCNDGKRIKASQNVEELLKEGVGATPETALKLRIEDLPAVFWFSYVYLHASHDAKVVSQRIKLGDLPVSSERLAHITNYIFQNHFLPNKLRPYVQWQKVCGTKLSEETLIKDVLTWGEATCEDLSLKFVIGAIIMSTTATTTCPATTTTRRTMRLTIPTGSRTTATVSPIMATVPASHTTATTRMNLTIPSSASRTMGTISTLSHTTATIPLLTLLVLLSSIIFLTTRSTSTAPATVSINLGSIPVQIVFS